MGDVVAEEEARGALLKPLKLTINDPAFPISMYLKNERGETVSNPSASKDLYRVAQQISKQIRFLPVEGVTLKVEYHDKNKLKDYPALLDCVLRVLYRACIIECMSKQIRPILSRVQALNSIKRSIQSDPDMTPAEKRDELNEIQQEIISLSKEAQEFKKEVPLRLR